MFPINYLSVIVIRESLWARMKNQDQPILNKWSAILFFFFVSMVTIEYEFDLHWGILHFKFYKMQMWWYYTLMVLHLMVLHLDGITLKSNVLIGWFWRMRTQSEYCIYTLTSVLMTCFLSTNSSFVWQLGLVLYRRIKYIPQYVLFSQWYIITNTLLSWAFINYYLSN